MLSGKINDLFNFACCNVTGIDTADATPFSVYRHHDTCRTIFIHPEDGLKDVHDEIHWCEVVIE